MHWVRPIYLGGRPAAMCAANAVASFEGFSPASTLWA
jgi:hypothetical protein